MSGFMSVLQLTHQLCTPLCRLLLGPRCEEGDHHGKMTEVPLQ